MEFFPVELQTLATAKPIKNSSKTATFSPVIGPAGIISSAERIVL